MKIWILLILLVFSCDFSGKKKMCDKYYFLDSFNGDREFVGYVEDGVIRRRVYGIPKKFVCTKLYFVVKMKSNDFYLVNLKNDNIFLNGDEIVKGPLTKNEIITFFNLKNIDELNLISINW